MRATMNFRETERCGILDRCISASLSISPPRDMASVGLFTHGVSTDSRYASTNVVVGGQVWACEHVDDRCAWQ